MTMLGDYPDGFPDIFALTTRFLERSGRVLIDIEGGLPREKPIEAKPLHAWASSTGDCERKIGYEVGGYPPTPADPESRWDMSVGSLLGRMVQAAMLVEVGATIEVPFSLRDGFITGRADAVWTWRKQLVLTEVKVLKPYPFELATGARRGNEPKGPKPGDVAQAAIGAGALGASLIHVLYVSRAAFSGDPIMAQWVFTPRLEISDDAVANLLNVVDLVHGGLLPAPVFEGKVLEWVQLTTVGKGGKSRRGWPCGYCGYAGDCVARGRGEIELPPMWTRESFS